jgi:hypothetical protein
MAGNYANAASRRMAKTPAGPNSAAPAKKGLPPGLLGYMAKKKGGGENPSKPDPNEPDADDAAPVSKPNATSGAKPNAHAPVGQGGRFAAMEAKGVSPALAAFIGRKKYGAGKMASMAAKGRQGG